MTSLITKAYRDGWLRERKLHMIWRAIARRHLSRLRDLRPFELPDMNGETDA